MHALGTVASGVAAFLFAHFYLHLPQTICFYAAMPFALPVAIAGFLKIDGMTPMEYLRRRKEIRRIPEYFYCPEPLSESFHEGTGGLDQAGEKTQKDKNKQVFITGLSASEKEKLSFRESDFVKAVSTFLSSKRIDARTVEFLRKMDISADGAQEYLAVLPGHDDFYLVVLMYPEYPGKYILSFLDLDGLAGSVKEKKKQDDTTPETSAVNTPIQTVQTQPVAVSPPVQTQLSAETQNTSPGEAKYDATDLTIMAVPSTLSNYLDNRYELQYTLYDYLFRNGKRGVSTAAVDDFDIDPDDRIAEITFELDDGSTVYGSYDKDSNSYSYSS